MSSLFQKFQKFRSLFVNDNLIPEDLTYLLERIQKMAVDLTQLTQEVDRVRETQEKAAAVITNLVTEIKTVTDQLVAKTAEAENTVDVNIINEMIAKLKESTDSLSAVLPAPAAPQ